MRNIDDLLLAAGSMRDLIDQERRKGDESNTEYIDMLEGHIKVIIQAYNELAGINEKQDY